MSKGLIEYICPRCRASLDDATHGERRTVCSACAVEFAVFEGVPILIDDAFSYFNQDSILAAAQLAVGNAPGPSPATSDYKRGVFGASKQFVFDAIERSPTIYSKPRQVEVAEIMLRWIRDVDSHLASTSGSDQPLMLVVGGGTTGMIASVLQDSGAVRTVSSDVYWTPQTDVVCDSRQIPLDDGSVDIVLAEGVFEHVLRPADALAEIHRILKPDGLLLFTTPFLLGVHMETMDYQRWTHTGLIDLAREFELLECRPIEGPLVAFAYQLSYVSMALSPARYIGIVKHCVNFFVGWLKYLGLPLRRRALGEDSASSVYFIGKRSSSRMSDSEINAHFTGVGICPK